MRLWHYLAVPGCQVGTAESPTQITETERCRNSETAREKRKIETELNIDREEKRCIEQRKIENMTLTDR